MVVHSAGVALWRRGHRGDVELLVVHPGGPFWSGKNEHAWSIPKGEFDPQVESGEVAARREWAEEMGSPLPVQVVLQPLAVVKAGGKHIHPFCGSGDFDVATLRSNTTEIEWPPRSGRRLEIPEIDAAAWIRLEDAEGYLHKGQRPLVRSLEEFVSEPS